MEELRAGVRAKAKSGEVSHITFHDIRETAKLMLLTGILYALVRNPLEPKLDVNCISGVVQVIAYAPGIKKMTRDEIDDICKRGE